MIENSLRMMLDIRHLVRSITFLEPRVVIVLRFKDYVKEPVNDSFGAFKFPAFSFATQHRGLCSLHTAADFHTKSNQKAERNASEESRQKVNFSPRSDPDPDHRGQPINHGISIESKIVCCDRRTVNFIL